MVGKRVETVNKPSRSDEALNPEQQLQITHEVEAHFESMAPKRPLKPNRSEPDPDASLSAHQHPHSIPELHKLLSLKSHHHPLQGIGGKWVELLEQQELVETEYYKQLQSIDKHHHTTGTGFIKAAKEGVDHENGDDDHEIPKLSQNGGDIKMGASCGYKSNPATNDWTPSVDDINQ